MRMAAADLFDAVLPAAAMQRAGAAFVHRSGFLLEDGCVKSLAVDPGHQRLQLHAVFALGGTAGKEKAGSWRVLPVCKNFP